ncbi:hypothetical protein BJ742DRAFT_784942 [Cladochytrium replicatum]|nr:hypothetical protein BJ742DRAFT_784942 [Cladochytrium replicatum]
MAGRDDHDGSSSSVGPSTITTITDDVPAGDPPPYTPAFVNPHISGQNESRPAGASAIVIDASPENSRTTYIPPIHGKPTVQQLAEVFEIDDTSTPPTSTPHHSTVGAVKKAFENIQVRTLWKRIALGLVALVILAGVISGVIIGTSNSRSDSYPNSNITVKFIAAHTFADTSLEVTSSRSMIAVDDLAVVVFDRVGVFNNSGGIGWFKSTTNTSGYLKIDSDVTISYLTHYTDNSFLALNMTAGLFGLVEIQVGTAALDPSPSVTYRPLGNIASSNFALPIKDGSMHFLKDSRTLFVAMVDNNLTTWIYRIKYPEFTVETNASVPVSATRGYLRFAESAGVTNTSSDNSAFALLMRPTVATYLDESLALLIPGNLTLVFPSRAGAEYSPYLGPTSRASMSPTARYLNYIIVMGDRAKIDTDSSGGSFCHSSTVYPFGQFSSSWSYFPEIQQQFLRDILVHGSGMWNIYAFDNKLSVSDAYNSDRARDAVVKLEGEGVEAIASTGSSDLFVLTTTNSSGISVSRYTISQSPKILR